MERKCDCKDGFVWLPSAEGGYYDPHPCVKCAEKAATPIKDHPLGQEIIDKLKSGELVIS